MVGRWKGLRGSGGVWGWWVHVQHAWCGGQGVGRARNYYLAGHACNRVYTQVVCVHRDCAPCPTTSSRPEEPGGTLGGTRTQALSPQPSFTPNP